MKNTTTTDLGTRLKSYEKSFETTINNSQHIIVRIDGHKFSTYTKGFKKPFDKILGDTMVEVTEALVETFKASCGYTQSDEITLIIPSYKNIFVDNRKTKSDKKHHKIEEKECIDWTHNLGGRVQKIVSLTSAFATKEFNKILNKKIQEAYNSASLITLNNEDLSYLNIISNKVNEAWFDARVYGVDNEDEAFNSLLWRVRDAEKNSISNAAYAHLSHKKLMNIDGSKRKEILFEEKGIDWEKDYEDMFKYGVIIKKQKYNKILDNGETCIRTKFIRFSTKLTYSKDNVKMVMSKFLED